MFTFQIFFTITGIAADGLYNLSKSKHFKMATETDSVSTYNGHLLPDIASLFTSEIEVSCVKMESEPHFTNCLKIGTPQSSVKHEPHSDHEVDHSYSTGQELLSDAFTFVEVKSELEENIKDVASMWKLSHKRRVRNISSIRRSKDAERQRVKRCTESQEKRAERLRKDAERKRTKRAAEVASERARRLRSNVDRRATETEAERAERLKRDAERQRLKRATETEDERARRLRRDNERKRFKRATESEAERTERLRKDTERKRFKRAAEMQTDRTKRLHIRTEQQNGVHWGQDGQAEHSLFGPLLQVSVAFPKFLEEIEIFPRVGSEPRETQSSVSSDKMHVPPCERTSDSSVSESLHMNWDSRFDLQCGNTNSFENTTSISRSQSDYSDKKCFYMPWHPPFKQKSYPNNTSPVHFKDSWEGNSFLLKRLLTQQTTITPIESIK
ncbi:histone-lysine N-methyltransferase, H3 lysine-79 specific-like isoform X2 [Periplaneta americana]|uniref:histone-lysine N-methyltransferase, H3 lysine-79 specific-like isoform X2 n=1 Tax=Periplaneta americana TaxID=6978 RepID=UPI0037E7303D